MIDKIVKKLEEANEKYRQGNPIISDYEYDKLLETLSEYDPNNEYFNKIGIEVDDDRKRKLEHPMASINKVKTIDDIRNWIRLKNINLKSEIICTPKYDGLSFLVNEKDNTATTRGDGKYGQKSDEHYKLIQNHLKLNTNIFSHTYGEVILPKRIFLDKYSNEFANPRNLVAGLINSKDISDSVKDIQYIKYGAIPNDGYNFTNKSEIIDILNSGQDVKVDYHLLIAEDITEEILINLFHEWSVNYEIDGIILEVNSLELQEKLGRDKSTNNPSYSIAFKHESFEQKAETEVIGISWNISKQGLLKPILHINPVKLDGVTVSNVTGNNARFVKDMGIGVGAKVVVKRSGMVIPLIVDVLQTVDFVMPVVEGTEIDWSESGIELITLTETDEQKLRKNIAFFEILEAENVSEGVITQLWDAGYQTIESILNLTQSDLEKIDRFGKRKAQIVFTSIQKCIKDVQLSKLQHATGIFKGLGKLRLVKLEHFTKKPSLEEVMMIDGFAESSAKSYIDGYDTFFDFIKNLPITIAKKESINKTGNDLEGTTFVFTGVRRSDLVKIIESRGGKEGTSVSKNTTHLVCVDKNSSSSKMNKAKELGVKILDVDDLEKLLS
jgi:NAD-dependent DNA ligase